MNKTEYINFARKNEAEMKSAIYTFHPYFAEGSNADYNISAPAAETACKVVRKQIKDETIESPIKQYLEYDADTIMSIANAVWFGMPESSSVRNHSAFAVVCELAEGYL